MAPESNLQSFVAIAEVPAVTAKVTATVGLISVASWVGALTVNVDSAALTLKPIVEEVFELPALSVAVIVIVC